MMEVTDPVTREVNTTNHSPTDRLDPRTNRSHPSTRRNYPMAISTLDCPNNPSNGRVDFDESFRSSSCRDRQNDRSRIHHNMTDTSFDPTTPNKEEAKEEDNYDEWWNQVNFCPERYHQARESGITNPQTNTPNTTGRELSAMDTDAGRGPSDASARNEEEEFMRQALLSLLNTSADPDMQSTDMRTPVPEYHAEGTPVVPSPQGQLTTMEDSASRGQSYDVSRNSCDINTQTQVPNTQGPGRLTNIGMVHQAQLRAYRTETRYMSSTEIRIVEISIT